MAYMNIVKPSVKEIVNKTPGKKMEFCGRVCYKSDSKINDDSYVKFLRNIAKSGHTSVLEHERVCFEVSSGVDLASFVRSMKFFSVSDVAGKKFVSANVRAWLENVGAESAFYPHLKSLYPFLFEDECAVDGSSVKIVDENYLSLVFADERKSIEYAHSARTFQITCSRACTHQLVRHRAFSFSQQSQRYCNFSGDKFGHSIDFIMPVFDDVKEFSAEEKSKIEARFKESLERIESDYFDLVDNLKLRAEDARAILPNAAASVIVMTGRPCDWEGFFALRCDAHAQREIRDVAFAIRDLLSK